MTARRTAAALAALALLLAALAGCSATSTGTPTTAAPPTSDGPVIAPVTVDANDLQGTTVEIEVGQVLNINTGDLAVDSYTGEVEDPAVAEFTQGREDGGATFNPGVVGLSEGSTQVTMTNDDGGIQPLVFTVSVGTVTG